MRGRVGEGVGASLFHATLSCYGQDRKESSDVGRIRSRRTRGRADSDVEEMLHPQIDKVQRTAD